MKQILRGKTEVKLVSLLGKEIKGTRSDASKFALGWRLAFLTANLLL